MRDEVTEVLLEAEEGGGRSLRRRQWGVFWVLGLLVYGRMLVKEIAGVAVRQTWHQNVLFAVAASSCG